MNAKFHLADLKRFDARWSFSAYVHESLYGRGPLVEQELTIEGIITLINHSQNVSNTTETVEFILFVSPLYDPEEVWVRLHDKLQERVRMVEWGARLEVLADD